MNSTFSTLSDSFIALKLYQIVINFIHSFSDGTWYKLEKGWIPSNSVKIFSNKLRAESEQKRMDD
jgi:hypothetical protein